MIDTHLHEDLPATTPKTLRQFAGLCVLFGAGIAGWQWLGRDDLNLMSALAAGLICAGGIGLIKPEWIRPVYAALLTLTIPIGRVVSLGILAILFYFMFTPIAMFFRVIGRDALDRRRRERSTHWTPKRMPTDPRSYLRQ